MMAMRTNAIIVPMCCVWNRETEKYHVNYGKFIYPPNTGDRHRDVYEMTAAFTSEIEKFIRARVVIPGRAPTTSFATSAQERIAQGGWFPPAYEEFAGRVLAGMQAEAPGDLTTAEDVAAAVYRAATDPDCPMFVPAGADAIAWFNDH